MVDGLKLVQIIDASGMSPFSIIQDAIDYWCNIALLKVKTDRLDPGAGDCCFVGRCRISAGGTSRQ